MSLLQFKIFFLESICLAHITFDYKFIFNRSLITDSWISISTNNRIPRFEDGRDAALSSRILLLLLRVERYREEKDYAFHPREMEKGGRGDRRARLNDGIHAPAVDSPWMEAAEGLRKLNVPWMVFFRAR